MTVSSRRRSAPPASHRGAPAPWATVWVEGRPVEVLTLGTGTPVLFLHGWGLSPRSYLRSLHALAARGHQVIAPSLPGFGRSGPLPVRDQHVHGVADHVARVIDALGLDQPVNVLGHSFGGGVALRLAAEHPHLVRALTLVCPVGGAGNGAPPLPRMAAGVLLDARHRWALRAARDFGSAVTRHPAAIVATAYSAWRADLLTDLHRVGAGNTSVAFLFADADDVVSPGAIPDCVFDTVTCEVVSGRHSWLIGEPERFAEAVHDHLARDQNAPQAA